MVDFVEMCRGGEVEGGREALGRGADVNTRGMANWTGLMVAAMFGQEEVVEVLLAQPGVDVTCRDDCGNTALHLACIYSSAGLVRRLLTMPGVEVEARNSWGETPLMVAIKYEREELVRVLVEVEGIDLVISTITHTQRYALWGTLAGMPEIMAILVEARERREREVEERREREVEERKEAAARRSVEAWRRNMASLLESAPTTGDFTLVCQGEEVACHTTILLARCPTLAQGALSTMKEGVEGRWVVRSMEGEEVDVEVVRDLLTFIYTGTISEERVQERVEELLELAHMYQLAGLVDTCREAALQQITVDNSLHTLATLHKFAID